MPFRPLTIRPGVNTQPTPLLNAEGWSDSNLIRFKDGLLQKLGGCQRLADQTFVGTARELHPFVDLSGATYIAVGTNQRLMVYNQAAGLVDISPVRGTTNLTSAFATTAASSVVTLTDAVLNTITVLKGDWINIITATAIGGLLLQGFYLVTGIGGTSLTFDAGIQATSTASGGAALTFQATAGSRTIPISFSNGGYPLAPGQNITVAGSTTVGGTTIFGTYTIQAGPSIQAALAATSSATAQENGGKTEVQYLFSSAIEGAFQTGYGIGPYGYGPYGMTSGAAQFSDLRQWSLESWGQDLIASPSKGGIYVWTPPVSTGNVATLLTQAPAQNTGAFVAMPAQILVAYGCTDPISGQQDPLLVRWSDVSDFTDWTASATNQAGSYRIPLGTRIMRGLQAPTQMLFWTDLDLWSGQYEGFPFVFGFNRIGWACGLISKRAVAQLGGIILWMSQNGFFFYDGQSVQPLPCTVWDFVFDNLDRLWLGAVHAAANTYFNEAAWYFPIAGSNGQAVSYVKFNGHEWDHGTLPRSAWMDQSAFGSPIGADYNGYLQQHEIADDLDGTPMDSWALSGLIGLSEGSTMIFVERMLPDFVLADGAQVALTFYFYDHPTDANPRQRGPFTVAANTRYVVVRGRGRYVQVKVETAGTPAFWRMGKIEADASASGRR